MASKKIEIIGDGNVGFCSVASYCKCRSHRITTDYPLLITGMTIRVVTNTYYHQS